MNYDRERVDRVALTMSTGVSINCSISIFGEIFEVFYIQNLLESPNCLFVVWTMNIITNICVVYFICKIVIKYNHVFMLVNSHIFMLLNCQ